MVQPTDVPDHAALIARLEASEARQDMLSRALTRVTAQVAELVERLHSMEREVRTRRLVIVGDRGREQIVATADGDMPSIEVRGGAHRATIAPHMLRVCYGDDGGRAHLLATADDAELHLHSGPNGVLDPPQAARATLHALTGWRGPTPAGRASLELATGGVTNSSVVCG